jgi:hypothetical protein
VRREIAALDVLLTSKINAVSEAQLVFAKSMTDVPTIADRSVAAAVAVINEKFETIDQRFRVVDQQFKAVADQFVLNDKALVAALSAAKDAVAENTKWFKDTSDKSERSTADQIRQQSGLLSTNYQALRDLIAAIDTRVTRFEGLGLGTAAATSTQRDDQRLRQSSNSYAAYLVFAAAGLLVGVAGIILAIVK